MNLSLVELIYSFLFFASIIVMIIFLTKMILVMKFSHDKTKNHYKKLSVGLILMFGSYFTDFIIKLTGIIFYSRELSLYDVFISSAYFLSFIIYSFVLKSILVDNYGEDIKSNNK